MPFSNSGCVAGASRAAGAWYGAMYVHAAGGLEFVLFIVKQDVVFQANKYVVCSEELHF